MPVTFTVANHQAEPVSEKHYADLPLGGKSQTTLLKAAARGPSTGFQKLLQSSFRDDELLNIYPSSNGLVYACIHVPSFFPLPRLLPSINESRRTTGTTTL